MIHGENSKKAAITAMTIAANGKKADDEKTLESIKYINDKDAEVSKNGEEKWTRFETKIKEKHEFVLFLKISISRL